MKGFITKVIIISMSSLLLISIGHAKNDKMMMMKSKWTCESNSSKSSEEQKPMSAKDAFVKAMKDCGDCTKITCTMESQ